MLVMDCVPRPVRFAVRISTVGLQQILWQDTEHGSGMEKAMEERGTPVRHACFYRKDKPCKRDPMLSTESPSNESILQLQNPCTRAT